MRLLPLAALLLALGVLPSAAQSADEELQARLEKKLAEPFLKRAAWHLDYDEALEAAQESGKPIFLYFTRSYAP